MDMDRFAEILQAVGYHAAILQPLLPMYLHLISSAIFPIYTGGHASLTCPSSAAKSFKKKKRRGEDQDDEEENEHKMEGLSPMDAVVLPVLGGLTLAGLYFLIKWLEDPAMLNKMLNWYFSIFGTLSLARLLTDSMGTVTSFILPDLPMTALPSRIESLLGYLRKLPSRKLHVRFYIHNVVSANFRIGPQGATGLAIAMFAQLYFNLVDKPWWLTNLLGFSFAYSALQFMSPTTSWTGTLILGALFVYDIYFVFFTPLMVTVATQLDIPAKLLFPRPRGSGEDPTKQAMSMLGLGDVILPGMMIGFALRFDLYLFYLRKQKRRTIQDPSMSDEGHTDESAKRNETPSDIVKAKWRPATGRWGERFWTTITYNGFPDMFQGRIFPKTYFHASLTGYIVGMLFTLGVMQAYGHAQPALLYLVPGTLGALWGTALFKGDIKAMWEYTEAEEEEEEKSDGKDEEKAFEWFEWTKSWFIGGSVTKSPQPKVDDQTSNGRPSAQRNMTNVKTKEAEFHKTNRSFARDRKSELIFFSIELSRRIMKEASEEDEDDKAVAYRTRSKATKSETEGHNTPEEHIAKRTRARTKNAESRSSTDLGETW